MGARRGRKARTPRSWQQRRRGRRGPMATPLAVAAALAAASGASAQGGAGAPGTQQTPTQAYPGTLNLLMGKLEDAKVQADADLVAISDELEGEVEEASRCGHDAEGLVRLRYIANSVLFSTAAEFADVAAETSAELEAWWKAGMSTGEGRGGPLRRLLVRLLFVISRCCRLAEYINEVELQRDGGGAAPATHHAGHHAGLGPRDVAAESLLPYQWHQERELQGETEAEEEQGRNEHRLGMGGGLAAETPVAYQGPRTPERPRPQTAGPLRRVSSVPAQFKGLKLDGRNAPANGRGGVASMADGDAMWSGGEGEDTRRMVLLLLPGAPDLLDLERGPGKTLCRVCEQIWLPPSLLSSHGPVCAAMEEAREGARGNARLWLTQVTKHVREAADQAPSAGEAGLLSAEDVLSTVAKALQVAGGEGRLGWAWLSDNDIEGVLKALLLHEHWLEGMLAAAMQAKERSAFSIAMCAYGRAAASAIGDLQSGLRADCTRRGIVVSVAPHPGAGGAEGGGGNAASAAAVLGLAPALIPFSPTQMPRRKPSRSMLDGDADARMHVSDFEVLKPISSGAYGRVFLARKRTTGDVFALKVLRKDDMLRKNQIANVQAERDILSSFPNDSPHVVHLFYAFTSERHLYLVMEYLEGGDLQSLLGAMGALPEKAARQYVAEIVLALEYLHSQGIVHRDLKPDNLLLGRDGHIRLTDFGLSHRGIVEATARSPGRLAGPVSAGLQAPDSPGSPGLPGLDQHFARSPLGLGAQVSPVTVAAQPASGTPEGRKMEVVGTPDYLAPEVLLGRGHGPASDLWSVGIVLYELLTGAPPFNDSCVESIFRNILEGRIDYPERRPGGDEDEGMSPEAVDLIRGLLHPDPGYRLDPTAVKSHPFFEGIVWEALLSSEPPFLPVLDGEEDTSYYAADLRKQSRPEAMVASWKQSFVGTVADDDPSSDVGESSRSTGGVAVPHSLRIVIPDPSLPEDATPLGGIEGSLKVDGDNAVAGSKLTVEGTPMSPDAFVNFSYKNLRQLRQWNSERSLLGDDATG